LPLGPPQQRAVLALLLLRDGAQTSVEEIIDALWSGRAPGSADNVVRSYISRLRYISNGCAGSSVRLTRCRSR
jgi:DNA-binding SARP family transcriptional activator